MASVGTWNELKLLQRAPEGAFLDGGEHGEVFLPLKQVPPDVKPGQTLRVFVYLDAEDYLTATMQPPLAQMGEVAHLKIVGGNRDGAMLAWGPPQNLFMPWSEVKPEHRPRIQAGAKVLVILCPDAHGRVIASTRLEKYLKDEADEFAEGDKVSLIIGDPTDLGVRVIVNHRYWGMVHRSDIFGTLAKGEVREGYIKALRPDLKLDITLQASGYAKVDAVSQKVLDLLKRRNGYLPLTDKSSPEQIYDQLGVSKKAFKQAIGTLYKQRQILIEPEGIRLLK